MNRQRKQHILILQQVPTHTRYPLSNPGASAQHGFSAHGHYTPAIPSTVPERRAVEKPRTTYMHTVRSGWFASCASIRRAALPSVRKSSPLPSPTKETLSLLPYLPTYLAKVQSTKALTPDTHLIPQSASGSVSQGKKQGME